MAYDPEWRHRAGVNKSSRVGQVRNDERADWSAAWALFPGNIAYVWHGALHATTVAESLVRELTSLMPVEWFWDLLPRGLHPGHPLRGHGSGVVAVAGGGFVPAPLRAQG